MINIIVSDTTALIVLARSDALFLLSNLFDKVYIPQAVMDEINSKNDIVSQKINLSDFIEVKKINNKDILQEIQKSTLDMGKVEAISLALELKSKLLIDEKKGRKSAKNRGLQIVGLLGVLRENYMLEFIDLEQLTTYFQAFKENQYRMSKELEKIFFFSLKY